MLETSHGAATAPIHLTVPSHRRSHLLLPCFYQVLSLWFSPLAGCKLSHLCAGMWLAHLRRFYWARLGQRWQTAWWEGTGGQGRLSACLLNVLVSQCP